MLKAVANVEDELAGVLVGRDAAGQAAIDRTMIELDGTPNKARLGANAILGCSLAVAAPRPPTTPGSRSTATSAAPRANRLPVPLMNILNGGVHADNSVDLQEFMVAPVGARTLADAVRMGAEVYARAEGRCCATRGLATGVGDEGGFAPDLDEQRGRARGHHGGDLGGRVQRRRSEVALALDPATTELYRDGAYHLDGEGRTLEPEEMVEYWAELVRALPDRLDRGRHGGGGLGRLGEADRAPRRAGSSSSGDDLFVTNTDRLRARASSSARATPCW